MDSDIQTPGVLEPVRRWRKLWLAGEWAALYLGLPVAYTAGWIPITLIPFLLLMTAGCWLWLRRQPNLTTSLVWRSKVSGREWRRILLIYAVAVPILAALLWLIQPEGLFSLVRWHPGWWVLVMVAYPVLSVLPQEVIYRVFFFERYAPLFGRGTGLLLASTVTFGFGHIIFHNWPAVGLTLAGGWLFANTCQRTRSVWAVAGDHALYGCAVFTLGYGPLFYEGTLRWLRH